MGEREGGELEVMDRSSGDVEETGGKRSPPTGLSSLSIFGDTRDESEEEEEEDMLRREDMEDIGEKADFSLSRNKWA